MKITDAATLIARVRAAEAELPPEARLFDDPFARLFMNENEASFAEIAGQFSAVPLLREQVRLRTRFIDDFVRRGVADGFHQIVVLGAGFDCRALRLEEIAASGARVFEVDLEEQFATKRAVLEAAAVLIPERLKLIACDFNADDFEWALTKALLAAGFTVGGPTLFIWEGVISYLNATEIERTLSWIVVVSAPGSRVVFNYTINQLIGLDPQAMSARAKAAGFASVDDRSLGSLHREYLAADPPGDTEQMAELFRVAVAVR